MRNLGREVFRVGPPELWNTLGSTSFQNCAASLPPFGAGLLPWSYASCGSRGWGERADEPDGSDLEVHCGNLGGREAIWISDHVA